MTSKSRTPDPIYKQQTISNLGNGTGQTVLLRNVTQGHCNIWITQNYLPVSIMPFTTNIRTIRKNSHQVHFIRDWWNSIRPKPIKPWISSSSRNQMNVNFIFHPFTLDSFLPCLSSAEIAPTRIRSDAWKGYKRIASLQRHYFNLVGRVGSKPTYGYRQEMV